MYTREQKCKVNFTALNQSQCSTRNHVRPHLTFTDDVESILCQHFFPSSPNFPRLSYLSQLTRVMTNALFFSPSRSHKTVKTYALLMIFARHSLFSSSHFPFLRQETLRRPSRPAVQGCQDDPHNHPEGRPQSHAYGDEVQPLCHEVQKVLLGVPELGRGRGGCGEAGGGHLEVTGWPLGEVDRGQEVGKGRVVRGKVAAVAVWRHGVNFTPN